MKFIGIIPARYASTRFPAKPLAVLGGKTVIQRVYEQVTGALDEAYVATDDERIEAAVKSFGGKVVMTSVHHKSGTDRCYEAFQKVGKGYDVIVNIQGDEPFIRHAQLEAIKACFEDYNKVYWQDKNLKIKAIHHDGTNHFIIKKLTDRGIEFYNNHYYDYDDRTMHQKLFKDAHYSHSVDFFARIYGWVKDRKEVK